MSVIWDPEIKHDGISLKFRNGEVVEAPGKAFSAPTDADYHSMLREFTEHTAKVAAH